MKHKTLLGSVLVLLSSVNASNAKEFSNKELCAGATVLVVAGSIVTLTAEHTFVPWITGRNEQQQRKKAYLQTAAIRRKYEDNFPELNTLRLHELENYIKELRTDKATLERFIHSVPFKSTDPSKSAQPIEMLLNSVSKQLKVVETQYATAYLNQVCEQYNKELSLNKTEKLNQTVAKECIDEQFGASPYRNHMYTDKLEGEILSCTALFEQLGNDAVTDDVKNKLGSLDSLLRTIKRQLTTELQHELEVKDKNEWEQKKREAELSRTHEETTAYRKVAHVCDDLQTAVTTHKSMISDVKKEINGVTKAVHEVKEEVGQGRLWEQFIRGLDQAGSENRIVNALKQELDRIRRDITIIKERTKGSQQAGYAPTEGDMPPPFNPEFGASQNSPSAPPYEGR